MSIKDIKKTAVNVWHANENAKARVAAEKAAKRNAIIGGGGTVIACMAGLITSCRWRIKYLSLERHIDNLTSRISEMENKVNDPYHDFKEEKIEGEVDD